MGSEREVKLEELVEELLYLVQEIPLPRCEFHRRAAEAAVKAREILSGGGAKR